jgi:ferredoxin-NADP reductase
MLTEPQTTPPTKNLRIAYGTLVGALFATTWKIGPIFATPEAALIVGNIFSYLVSPKEKLLLKLKKRACLAEDIYEFTFAGTGPIKYKPGQYMEWTLAHGDSDSRGVRRYFTLASSPTEEELKIGVKFSDNGSSFKKSLLTIGDKNIVASQLAGDFTLPKNKNQKLVFIAGGIGITPFRSMLKYLDDKNENRDIVLFYTAKTPGEFVYKDIFAEAEKRLGIKTIYVATKISGRLDEHKIKEAVPDYKERVFYLSGPHALVEAFKSSLSNLKVKGIKTDYFPGYT